MVRETLADGNKVEIRLFFFPYFKKVNLFILR